MAAARCMACHERRVLNSESTCAECERFISWFRSAVYALLILELAQDPRVQELLGDIGKAIATALGEPPTGV